MGTRAQGYLGLGCPCVCLPWKAGATEWELTRPSDKLLIYIKGTVPLGDGEQPGSREEIKRGRSIPGQEVITMADHSLDIRCHLSTECFI